MKVIVCGAGQVGFNIAKHLASQQNDVTVIDRSATLTRRIGELLDVKAVQGHASDPGMLERAGAADADLLVAVTMSDEVNMIACQVAHTLFSVTTRVARIRNQAYLEGTWADLFARDSLPIDVIISPEIEVAEALYRRLLVPGAFNMLPFADGKIRVLGLPLGENCPVVNTPLRQLSELFPNLRTVVLAVLRGERIFVPRSDDSLQVGDSIYIAVDSKTTDRAMAVFGHEETTAQRIVIVGGGNVGLFLARKLEERSRAVHVKVIERKAERAEFIAEHLQSSIVINGDALDRDILTEANVAQADAVVAVADDDEVNILSTLLAKREGCPRAMALMINPVYGSLVGSLGVDVALDPREVTVSSIVRHIRKGRIRDLYSIRDGQAEIIEAEVLEGSEAAGQSIRDLKLKGDVRIGLLLRDEAVVVPTPEERLHPGDHVVVLALQDAVRRIEQLFSARADVF